MREIDLLEKTIGDVLTSEGAALGWEQLTDLGLPLAGVSEERGGAGGGLSAAATVVRVAAPHALRLPLGETAILAGWLLERAGIDVPACPLTVATLVSASVGNGRVSGFAARVPWARSAEAIVFVVDGGVGIVPMAAASVTPGENLAGEERDDVSLVDVAAQIVSTQCGPNELHTRGALLRALGIVGVLERVLELTVRYANEREQFGRPIGRFQAVQQSVAILAGEVTAARAAVDLAVERPEPLWIGAAKIRAGDAAGIAATIAHQVHGAVGYTQEHQLHTLTRRLWAWRDEYGSEAAWSARVGAIVAASGDPWSLLTVAA